MKTASEDESRGNRPCALRNSLLIRSSFAALAIVAAQPALAQDADDQQADEATPEEAAPTIVVTGEIARTIENSLETKRQLDVIGDAIVGDDVGDLPDLSVAETLERIVGVTSDRFKGGASDLSVRGLGSFLGSSTIDGREISSGSDGRSVNFGQFPSELVNGAIVYKSQQASFIEGGVSGIIELQALKPLEYGKRRIQIQGLAGYSPYEDRVQDGQPGSYRITGSYVDQYQLGDGEIGIAIGGQLRRDTAPEDVYTTSSTWRPCNTIDGVDRSNDCAYLTDATGNPTGASDTYFVSNQYIYRAMKTQADRDAIMGLIEIAPTPNFSITLDGQYSYRDDIEERANLVIADGRRDIAPIAISPSGALQAWSGESRIENQSVWRQRIEEYVGLGGNIEWSGGPLTLSADVAYSQTQRRQDELDMRVRTNSRVFYEIDQRDTNVPNLTFTNVTPVENNTGLPFDLNNHDIYTNGDRARRRLENADDSIIAVRFDATYETQGFFDSIQAGFRFADRQRVQDDGIDQDVMLLPGGYDNAAAVAARRQGFLVEDLFTGASNTNVQGLTFAIWDPQELFIALTGSRDAGLPGQGVSTLSAEDTNVTEKSYAGYLQANFDAVMFDVPARGNIGLRAVQTETRSVGISSALVTTPSLANPGEFVVTQVGTPTINVERNDYFNWLPSANLILELDPDKLLRLAAYRAIARPDQLDLSAGLTFDDETSGGSLGSIVGASGNPYLEPLTSWNADASFEWYAGPTTSLAIAVYAKQLQTGFRTDVTPLTLTVDGAQQQVIIGRTVNSNEKSRLLGFEIGAQHKFDFGLGFQVNYNFADSNFEFEDPTVIDGNALRDFVAPANIPGYSRHSANATAFFERDWFSARVAYKWRSQYFKPFRTQPLRYTEDQGFLDLSLNIDVTRNIQLRFQALNVLDEPNVFYRPTDDSLAQADYSGARYFVGVRGRF